MFKRILILFLGTFLAASAADTQRIKTMKILSPAGQPKLLLRFDYDQRGAISRISRFDSKGNLQAVQYFFYENGCVAYRKEFHQGNLDFVQKHSEITECRAGLEQRFDSKGNPIGSTKYIFEDNRLKTFISYDQTGKKVAEASTNYTNTQLQSMQIQVGQQIKTVKYFYTGGKLKRMEEWVENPEGTFYTVQMIPVYESGSVTPEAARYFFE